MTALDINFLHRQAVEVRAKARTLKQRAEHILQDLKSATAPIKQHKKHQHHGRIVRKQFQ